VRIHHVVAEDNVDPDGLIRDPSRARHCVIAAGRLADLSGEVDPRTHLNLDYAAHRLGRCVVARALRRGEPVLRTGDHFTYAGVAARSLAHLGHVDLHQRRAAWLAAHRARAIRGERRP
jgi:hypothetical protein